MDRPAVRILTWAAGLLLGGGLTYWYSQSESASAAIESPEAEPRQQDIVNSSPNVTAPAAAGSTALTGQSRTPPAPRAADSAAPLDTCIVFGRVTTSKGEPVRRVLVQANTTQKPSIETRGDEAGGYTIVGLTPGKWRAVFTSQDHGEGVAEFTIAEREASKRVDVVLSPMLEFKIRFVRPNGERFKGTVKSTRGETETAADRTLGAGVPAGNLEVIPIAIATKERPPARISSYAEQHVTMLDIGTYWGPFARPNPAPPRDENTDGLLRVNGTYPFYVSTVVQGRVCKERLVSSYSEILDLEVDESALQAALASFTCQVKDASSGSPIKGAMVQLTSGASVNRLCETDAEGRARIESLLPGNYILRVEATKEFERFQEPVRMEAGRDLTRQVDLHAPMTVRGRVVDESGAPVQCRVFASTDQNAALPQELSLFAMGTSDAKGKFELTAGRRPMILTASAEKSGRGVVRIDPERDELDNVSLVLRRTVAVEMRFEGPAHVKPLVVVRDASGLPAAAFYAIAGQSHRLTFVPGAYRIEVESEAGPPRAHDLTVGDAPSAVDVKY